MNRDLLVARLNLHAVLQNIEDLVRLDPEMAEFSRSWNTSIQFSVFRGPAAYLEFKNGFCRHGIGTHPLPAIRLFFLSPGHLNRMFKNEAMPIPLKGFNQLGFLKTDFAKLTARLEYYLKPPSPIPDDPAYINIRTTMMLNTAVHAARELALLEPTCMKVAAATPPGVIQIGVLPDGPYAHLSMASGAVTAAKGPATKPSATMTFRDTRAAYALLSGQQDSFLAVAEGDVMLHGLLPMIDNIGLIFDRVEKYLA